jgi:hypothetical protein
MTDGPQTPIQEAISIISIVSILIAVGCYIAALNNAPVLSPALFWVAVQVYHVFPALARLPGSQMPTLVSAASVGGALWLVGIGFAGLLAQLFSAGQIQGIERQTVRLKRNRQKIAKRRRDRDGFDVS